jgi:hypothetical protein
LFPVLYPIGGPGVWRPVAAGVLALALVRIRTATRRGSELLLPEEQDG